MKSGIKIVCAEYQSGYKIKISFSDGKVNIFDYEGLVMRNHRESFPYRNIEKFKQFSIVDEREIAWGESWDMILPIETIYNKSGFFKAGRKKIEDKKMLIRLYVNESIIKANGGVESAQKKAISALLP